MLGNRDVRSEGGVTTPGVEAGIDRGSQEVRSLKGVFDLGGEATTVYSELPFSWS